MTASPRTSTDAWREVRDSGEDVTLRRRVAAALAVEAMTNHELYQVFPEKSANALRPRVNELIRMGCVERDGTRTTPSGNEAYVNHLTTTGRAYLSGDADPEPEPPLSELKADVVEVSRELVRGNADEDVLALALSRLDAQKNRLDPGGDNDG